MTTQIPCPFVHASGKACAGHVVRVETYKPDLSWRPGDDGRWKLTIETTRSHFHLFCSEKDNHAGNMRHDSERMKFYWDHLPEELRAAMV
jgi:hypothetical protein